MANTTKRKIANAEQEAVNQKLHQTAEIALKSLQQERSLPTSEPQSSAKVERGNWVGHSFATREGAEHAYQMLLDRGYESNEINLLMSAETREKFFSDAVEDTELNSKAQEDTAKTAATGSLKGAVIGTLLAVGSNMILPGVGLFLGGPLFIGLGALTGGLSGVLTESGVPPEQAAAYETEIKNGRIILGVTPHNEEDAHYFQRVWKNL